MRVALLLVFFLFLVVKGAEVDKRYFTPSTKQAFILEVQQQIKENPDPSLGQLESTLLTKIEQADQKESTLPFNTSNPVNPSTMTLPMIDTILGQLVATELLRRQTELKRSQLSAKLDYVKSSIEQITTEKKAQLLSYQLQYTLYQLILTKETTKEERCNAFIKQESKRVKKALPTLDTSSASKITDTLSQIRTTLTGLKEKRSELSAELEREVLLENPHTEKLNKQKEEIEKKLDESYNLLFHTILQEAIVTLAQKQQEPFYTALKEANSLLETIDPQKESESSLYYQWVKQLGKETFGSASMAMMASKESVTDTWAYLQALLFHPLFVFNEKAISSAAILKILAIFVGGFIVGALYRRRIANWSERWTKATPMTAKLTANLGYYFIIFITLIIALSSIGLDLSSFSMFASALAIGIGFGLQTVVSNMVAGIIMMFEQSIRIGDLIEINDTIKGTVTDVRIRSTVIKTFDNIDIVIPNASFIQNNVVNLTLDDKTRRLHIPFGVAYGTDVETLIEAILSELEQSKLIYYKGRDKDKKPAVRMVAMNSSSVDYELLVWIEWNTKKNPASIHSDFLILIYQTLYKYHIEIPFPQMDLHVKEFTSPKIA